MKKPQPMPNGKPAWVAIACGGTGGHFFPGLAVGDELRRRGWGVKLLVSQKEVDQRAVTAAQAGISGRLVAGPAGATFPSTGQQQGQHTMPDATLASMDVVTLPAVGLQGRNYLSFLRGFLKSLAVTRRMFRQSVPAAVLAMGGFTSAAPIFAGRWVGVCTFLHESNAIPGRANRWLARFVDEGFVGFVEAAERLGCRKVTVTGTPVRPGIGLCDAQQSRVVLGLLPDMPTLLVMGGSQGAGAINELMVAAMGRLRALVPGLQVVHLTGTRDFEKVSAAYARLGIKAVVQAFSGQMDVVLGAATVAVSRAGASALAELAAARVPAVLVPYPAASGNHQLYNARAFEQAGAACVLEERDATPERLCVLVEELIRNADLREKMRAGLAALHTPRAAEEIADGIIRRVTRREAFCVLGNPGIVEKFPNTTVVSCDG